MRAIAFAILAFAGCYEQVEIIKQGREINSGMRGFVTLLFLISLVCAVGGW